MDTMFNDVYYDDNTNDYLNYLLTDELEESDEDSDISVVAETDYSDLIQEISASPSINTSADHIISDFDAEVEKLRQEKLEAEKAYAPEPEFYGKCECPFCFDHNPEEAKARGYGAYGKMERWSGDDKYRKVYYVLKLLYEGYSVSESAKLLVTYFDESNLVRMASRVSNISRGNSHRAITGIQRSRSLSDRSQLKTAIDSVKSQVPNSTVLFDVYDQEFQTMLRTSVN